MLICFDIDGTLANCQHRVHFVRTNPKNWKAFDAGIPNDTVITQVAKIFEQFINTDHDVILASGRNEDSRAATERWLLDNNIQHYQKLYMRKSNDYRSDVIVKQEILLNEIVPDWGKKPDMVFDDRPGVVQMWRDNGIFVFDVYQGTEDF